VDDLTIRDPEPVQAFIHFLDGKDPKTIAAYRGTVRTFVVWLATMPGGDPFRMDLVTAAAIRGYLESLKAAGKAPRTQAKAITALQRFCRWAQDEGLLRHNPVAQIERPTVTTMAPTELTPEARYVFNTLVERQDSKRLTAIVALAYWAALRISEVATLRLGHCTVNQRSGAITIVDSKGGKTRTIDLHNEARRALYAYLYENPHAPDGRDLESAYVFTGQRVAWLRRHGQPDHLSPRAIEYLWMGLKRSATRDEWEHIKDITFHDLRHDWAHRARAAGWWLEEIAVYAGWTWPYDTCHPWKEISPVWLRSKARYSEVRPQARYTIHEQEIGSIGIQKNAW
jgi:site-specific recombinase XerD